MPGVQTGAQLERLEKKKPSFPAVEPVAVPANVAADLLARVAGFYARTLHKDRAGLDYLAERGLAQPAMLEAFRVGYCNGTLKTALPKTGEVVTQLQALGVLNAKGNEVFYGRKVEGDGARLNADSARHIYLAGGHRAALNAAAARHASRLVFTEAIFDALALWQAGETAAVPLYGADGWTEHHAALVREGSAAEIVLALDADQKGAAGTEQLRKELGELAPAVPVRAIVWPDGVKDPAESCAKAEDARADAGGDGWEGRRREGRRRGARGGRAGRLCAGVSKPALRSGRAGALGRGAAQGHREGHRRRAGPLPRRGPWTSTQGGRGACLQARRRGSSGCRPRRRRTTWRACWSRRSGT